MRPRLRVSGLVFSPHTSLGADFRSHRVHRYYLLVPTHARLRRPVVLIHRIFCDTTRTQRTLSPPTQYTIRSIYIQDSSAPFPSALPALQSLFSSHTNHSSACGVCLWTNFFAVTRSLRLVAFDPVDNITNREDRFLSISLPPTCRLGIAPRTTHAGYC